MLIVEQQIYSVNGDIVESLNNGLIFEIYTNVM